jgi:hypothetical protein
MATGDAGDGASPADGGDAGLSPELTLFCQKYTTAYCNDEQTCAFMNVPPLATCLSDTGAFCVQQVRSILGALSSGRAVFDASAVDACIADSLASFCANSNLGGAPSCSKVFHGTVATGSTCYAPYFTLLTNGDRLDECDGGVCSSTIQTCPGQCVAFLGANAACSTGAPSVPCGPGLYCDGTHCQQLQPTGAACTGLQQCLPPLTCGPHDSDSGAFVCETLKEQGQGCTYDVECDRFNCLTMTCRPGHQNEECAAYNKCDPGLVCTGAAGCQPPLAVDALCDPDYAACATGLACETTGLDDAGIPVGACHTIRNPTDGQPCFKLQCASGFWCQSTSSFSGTCHAPGNVGQTCAAGTAGSCATGLACNGSHVCQTRSGVGGPCDPDVTSTCADGLGCGANNTCEAKVGTGAACDVTAACPDGDYCDTTCGPAKLPGTPCTGKTGECIGGTCDTTRFKCNGDCQDPG